MEYSKLNYEGFENNLIAFIENVFGGFHWKFRFENNYGGSVIKHSGSYGGKQDLFEIAVIQFKNGDNHDYSLKFDTPITDDVLGHLSNEEVIETLNKIKGLGDESC